MVTYKKFEWLKPKLNQNTARKKSFDGEVSYSSILEDLKVFN